MRPTSETIRRDATVIDQAGAIVTAAVRQATERARVAAERCGCASCRAQAARTCLWAITMLQPAADPSRLTLR